MSIYQRIKDVASEKNLTVKDIEKALNFSNGSLRKWINNANSERLVQVANYLDVSTDYLLGRDNVNIKSDIEQFVIDNKGQVNSEFLSMITAFRLFHFNNELDKISLYDKYNIYHDVFMITQNLILDNLIGDKELEKKLLLELDIYTENHKNKLNYDKLDKTTDKTNYVFFKRKSIW